jgi:hypothetical protein
VLRQGRRRRFLIGRLACRKPVDRILIDQVLIDWRLVDWFLVDRFLIDQAAAVTSLRPLRERDAPAGLDQKLRPTPTSKNGAGSIAPEKAPQS